MGISIKDYNAADYNNSGWSVANNAAVNQKKPAVQNTYTAAAAPVSAPVAAAPASAGGESFDLVNWYAGQLAARRAAYEGTVAQQRQNYEYALGQVNSAADTALQQAYINRMLTLRALDQDLAARGLTGGMAESNRAGVYNNYGNSRNGIETSRAGSIGSLNNTLQNNLAAAYNSWQTGNASDLKGFTADLTGLAAQNGYNPVSMAGGMGGGDAAGLSALARLLRIAGLDQSGVAQYLYSAGQPAGSLADFLSALR